MIPELLLVLLLQQRRLQERLRRGQDGRGQVRELRRLRRGVGVVRRGDVQHRRRARRRTSA